MLSYHSHPMDPVRIDISTPSRAYSVTIGDGVLDRAGRMLDEIGVPSRRFVVSSPLVWRLHGPQLARAIPLAEPILVPDGERFKQLSTVSRIYDALVRASADRATTIITLGGGVIGDMAGFAAASYLRGVALVHVPTTLLAQVDSSVGGKTAINHPAGKNLVGAFYQPRLVLIDVATLKTLPRRELVAGLVEAIKHGVILDAELFALIEGQLERLLALDEELLQHVVRRNCELKAMVVQRDERESDYRSILNFGHTIGHAVESLTGYKRYLHGEAVAIGMAFAANLSYARGVCTKDTAMRIIELLKRVGLSVDLPREFAGPPLLAAIASDKKVASGKVKFVCVEALGQTRFEYLTPSEIVEPVAR